MTIKEVHDSILFQLNKSQWGHVSHEDIDKALDEAQITHFTNLFSDPREFERGQDPTPRVAYGETQKVHDELAPFIEELNFDPTQTHAGILEFPSDYQHLLSIAVLKNGQLKPVKRVSENDYPGLLSSHILGPTSAKPIVIMNGRGRVQFFPEIQFTGRAYYLRRPKKPLYSYTVNNRVETFDASKSIDLEWLDTSIVVIIQEAINWLSTNLRDQWSKQSSLSKISRDG